MDFGVRSVQRTGVNRLLRPGHLLCPRGHLPVPRRRGLRADRFRARQAKNLLDTWVQKILASLFAGLAFIIVGFGIWNWQFNEAFGVANPLSESIKSWWLGGTNMTEFADNLDPKLVPESDVLQIFSVFFIVYAAAMAALIHSAGLERVKACRSTSCRSRRRHRDAVPRLSDVGLGQPADERRRARLRRQLLVLHLRGRVGADPGVAGGTPARGSHPASWDGRPAAAQHGPNRIRRRPADVRHPVPRAGLRVLRARRRATSASR